MKKLLIAILFVVCNYQVEAQTLTVNNNTTCSINFSVIVSDPGTCDAGYNSMQVIIPAGNSFNYTNSSLNWTGSVPPPNSGMSGISILDDGQMKFAGDECAALPSNNSYISSCSGNTVNINWTNNGGGSATVDIN